MPRTARPRSAPAAPPVLLAFTLAACAPPPATRHEAPRPRALATAPAPYPEPSEPRASSGTSLALLAPDEGETPFQSWHLVNRNPDPIRGARHWPGLFGTIARQGPDGIWYDFPPPQGYCLTVSSIPELAPGQSMSVGELPLMGGERTLPPGRYRFVLPHIRASLPDQVFAAVLPFEVRGLDPQESEELAHMLDRDDIRACRDVWSFLLDTVERTAAPEVLPKIAAIRAQNLSLDEQTRALSVLTHFPEQIALLADLAKGPSTASLAAAIALLEARIRGTARKVALTRVAAAVEAKEEPPVRAIDALADHADELPPELVPRMIERLEKTKSIPHRVSLSMVLYRAGASGLGSDARAAVRAIRHAAQAIHDRTVREALLRMAAEIAEDLGDEPRQERGGWPLELLPETGGFADDPCRLLFSSLQTDPLLRFTPAAWPHSARERLRITYGTSGVEPYRPRTADD